MKNSTNEMKNAIENICIRTNHMEERTNDLENKNIEIIEEREPRF